MTRGAATISFAGIMRPGGKALQQPIDVNQLFCKLVLMRCIMTVNF
jgi:hypothetical protein